MYKHSDFSCALASAGKEGGRVKCKFCLKQCRIIAVLPGMDEKEEFIKIELPLCGYHLNDLRYVLCGGD